MSMALDVVARCYFRYEQFAIRAQRSASHSPFECGVSPTGAIVAQGAICIATSVNARVTVRALLVLRGADTRIGHIRVGP